jgi:hypothetical protein
MPARRGQARVWGRVKEGLPASICMLRRPNRSGRPAGPYAAARRTLGNHPLPYFFTDRYDFGICVRR